MRRGRRGGRAARRRGVAPHSADCIVAAGTVASARACLDPASRVVLLYSCGSAAELLPGCSCCNTAPYAAAVSPPRRARAPRCAAPAARRYSAVCSMYGRRHQSDMTPAPSSSSAAISIPATAPAAAGSSSFSSAAAEGLRSSYLLPAGRKEEGGGGSSSAARLWRSLSASSPTSSASDEQTPQRELNAGLAASSSSSPRGGGDQRWRQQQQPSASPPMPMSAASAMAGAVSSSWRVRGSCTAAQHMPWLLSPPDSMIPRTKAQIPADGFSLNGPSGMDGGGTPRTFGDMEGLAAPLILPRSNSQQLPSSGPATKYWNDAPVTVGADAPDAIGASSSQRQPPQPSSRGGAEESTDTILSPRARQHSQRMPTKQVANELMFGLILASMEIPCMIGYCQIIFKDPFFAPYIDNCLLKLVLFSCVVHQTSFIFASQLPFAVGSVQDAGLIFLSSMASNIVANCASDLSAGHLTHDDVLKTTLLTLGLATTMLGVALVLTGYFRLTNVVQYLPMPVVGGYLAYIGQFCLEAAVGLQTTASVAVDCTPLYKSLATGSCGWEHIWGGHDPCLIAVGVAVGLVLLLVEARATHFAALPLCMAMIPITFFLVLLATHSSVHDARVYGWLKFPPASHDGSGGDGSGDEVVRSGESWLSAHILAVWRPFVRGKVVWSAVLSCAPTWLAMYCVVCFSSCLDIAAIQMELGEMLDFDLEIKTVGTANVLSGLSGGFTGSYIFSETQFAMRGGVRTKLCGFVIIVCLLGAFLIPLPLTSIMPSFFFGGILCFIAASLLREWLLESRHRCTRTEYIVVWTTFVSVNLFDVELGMVLGVLAQILLFAVEYARAGVLITQRYWHSNVIRGFKQRSLTSKLRRDIVTLELHGFIFFGSAVRILDAIQQSLFTGGQFSDHSHQHCGAKQYQNQQRRSYENPVGVPGFRNSVPARDLARFLILDFFHVTGLDTTGAATCFVTLCQILAQRPEATRPTTVIFCHVAPRVRELLQAHHVLPPPLGAGDSTTGGHQEGEEASSAATAAHRWAVREFESTDEALEWCEAQLLAELDAGNIDRRAPKLSPRAAPDASGPLVTPPSVGDGSLATAWESPKQLTHTAPLEQSRGSVRASPDQRGGGGVAEVLSAFLTQYMLPDSIAGGVVGDDLTIVCGPGSINPFGMPRRAGTTAPVDAYPHAAHAPPAAAPGLRHRLPARRGLAKSLTGAMEEGPASSPPTLHMNDRDQPPPGVSWDGSAPPPSRRTAAAASSAAASESDGASAGAEIVHYFERLEVAEGDTIYMKADVADAMFILEEGSVQVIKQVVTPSSASRDGEASGRTDSGTGNGRGGRDGQLLYQRKRGKLLRWDAGTVFGEVEFFLRHRRYFTAVASSTPCVVHRLSWAGFDRLQVEQPQLACAFHTALMRWACRWVAADINDGRRHHGRDRGSEDIED
jgi:MFS superfamily sulfate permease-like transporter